MERTVRGLIRSAARYLRGEMPQSIRDGFIFELEEKGDLVQRAISKSDELNPKVRRAYPRWVTDKDKQVLSGNLPLYEASDKTLLEIFSAVEQMERGSRETYPQPPQQDRKLPSATNITFPRR